jgi:PAS domain S-box-containing protein
MHLTDLKAAARPGQAPEPITKDDVAILRYLVEGTARTSGEQFFQSLIRHLAAAVDVSHAFVAEFTEVKSRARTLAYWAGGAFQDNIEFDLAGTPCEEVVRGSLCHHPAGVHDLFPLDVPLTEMGIESYLGVPLRDEAGEVLGHLAVFDERPMPAEPRRLFTFRIFAARAAAELERLSFEQRLRHSEERYRELYEEAPNAYTIADLSGKLIEVNRRATELLGYSAQELVGSSIFDHVPDSPDAKKKARRAYETLLGGKDLVGVDGEFRKKDGSPLYVNLWVKTLRGGDGRVSGSRSIWVDVTERVLAEQERARLQQQNLYLQEEIKADHNFDEIIGQGATLAAVLDNVRRVAPTDSSVLIQGETGTGKELIARAIHSASKRADKPLVKVNCAALPAGLLESELFGHEKGAFTGAISRRLGRFELASGGTLFLDEVGEIPLEAQAKLLRALQEREIERLGGNGAIRIDVRVIAATNRDLGRAVADKTFRQDLFYRLNVVPIALPPLRERPEDIPLLVHFLANKLMTRIGKRVGSISQDTLGRLQRYSWPGNVRELENVLERAIILARGDSLEIEDGALAPLSQARSSGAVEESGGGTSTAKVEPAAEAGAASGPSASLDQVERAHILAALRQTGGVIDGPDGAARILDLHPNTLRSRMKKLGIKRLPREFS